MCVDFEDAGVFSKGFFRVVVDFFVVDVNCYVLFCIVVIFVFVGDG